MKTAFRVLIATSLVIGTYAEAGLITAMSVLWGYVALEITGMAIKRLSDVINDLANEMDEFMETITEKEAPNGSRDDN